VREGPDCANYLLAAARAELPVAGSKILEKKGSRRQPSIKDAMTLNGPAHGNDKLVIAAL